MRCCVPSCTNDTKTLIESDGLTFHRFPKERDLKNAWLEALGIFSWEPEENSAVCSEHFQQSAFYVTECGILRVKREAVPVSDVEIFSVLQMTQTKKEPNEEEMEGDNKDFKMKQELLKESEIAESSESYNTAYQLNGIMNTSLQKIEIKQELSVKETDTSLGIPIKQELHEIFESSKPNCTAVTNATDVTSINDSSANSNDMYVEAKLEEYTLPTNSEEDRLKNNTFKSKNTKNHTVSEYNTAKESFFLRKFNKMPIPCFKFEDETELDSLGLPMEESHIETLGSSKSNCSEVTPNATDVTSINDDFGHLVERRGKVLKKTRTSSKVRNAPTEKPYSCNSCDYRSKVKTKLYRHMKRHTDDKPYECKTCDFRTKYMECLNKHVKTHTGEKPFACNFCDYRCISKCSLSRHVLIHTGVKPYECKICDYRCAHKKYLKKHMMIHTGEKPYACGSCDFHCRDQSSLSKHKRIHTGEKPYECQLCDYKAALKEYLKRHTLLMHTAEKPFSCDNCEYSCKKKSVLSRHMRIHSGEKPYSCHMCDYRTVHKENLSSHVMIHTGEKPYACTICDYRGKDRNTLKQHLKKHTNVNPYVCQYCDYETQIKRCLISHTMIHTGEKPYACSSCDYTTKDASNLARHVGKHATVMPYACQKCDYKTTYKGYLTRHMKLHTLGKVPVGGKTFRCEICEYSSVSEWRFERHTRSRSHEDNLYLSNIISKEAAS